MAATDSYETASPFALAYLHSHYLDCVPQTKSIHVSKHCFA